MKLVAQIFFGAIVLFGIIIPFIIQGLTGSTKTNAPSPRTHQTTTQKPTPAKTESQSQASDLSEADKKEIAEYVLKNTESGTIQKIDVEFHKVYVNPLIWNLTNVEQKEHFTKMLALYCSFQSSYTGKYIDVFDYQSGKKLAKQGLLGFKVY